VQANLKIDTLQTELSGFQRYAEKEFVNHDDLKQLNSVKKPHSMIYGRI
jgi:hypothetical protein